MTTTSDPSRLLATSAAILAHRLRAHRTKSATFALIGLGGATTLLTMPGPLTPLLVATAVMLGAGHALVLRSPARPA